MILMKDAACLVDPSQNAGKITMKNWLPKFLQEAEKQRASQVQEQMREDWFSSDTVGVCHRVYSGFSNRTGFEFGQYSCNQSSYAISYVNLHGII